VGAADEDTQPFKDSGHVGTFQTVEAMLSLDEHFYEMCFLQSIQMHARGRRAHFSRHRKLGAGSRMAVH
jgi:hypothetical protein